MPLNFVRVAIAVVVTAPQDFIDRYLSEVYPGLGRRLAEQVNEYVHAHALGYYPALDFFESHPGLDPASLAMARHVATIIGDYVADEVVRRLRAPFSNVSVERVQSLAFTMPRVRCSQPDALKALCAHYSPNRVKLEVITSTIVKGDPPGMEQAARQKTLRWLKSRFDNVEITGSRRL
jgi:hypothetical protein